MRVAVPTSDLVATAGNTPAPAVRSLRQAASIRTQVLLLLAGLMLPMLALVVIVIDFYAIAVRGAEEARLHAQVRSLAATLDQRIESVHAALEVLVRADAIRNRDMEGFYQRCVEVAALLDGNIVLQDRDRRIFNTNRPFASEQLPRNDLGIIPIETGELSVTGLYMTPTSRRPVFSIGVPVREDGVPKYALSIVLGAESLTRLLHAQNFPSGWRVAILDSSGTFMARNVRIEDLLGRRAGAAFLGQIQATPAGVVYATTADGIAVLTGFTRTAAGWIVAIGVQREELEAPLRRSLLIIVLGGGLLLLVTGAGALRWGHRLARSTTALSTTAMALGRGEALPEVDRPAYREAEVVLASQLIAADLLARRAAERDAATADLRALAGNLEQLVTDRTAELDQALHTARKASRAKSDFLASMSHELRTPLNAVLGFAQVLEQQLVNSPQAEYVAYIRRGGEQLHSLISDVLNLTRIENGQLKVAIEPVALGPMLGQLRAMLKPTAVAAGVSLDWEPMEVALRVQADPVRLLQVFQNLASNAIKYNIPNGRVTIEVARTAPLPAPAPGAGRDFVRITFVDTGVGIPLARQGEMFQAFNRLGAEMGTIEGTGIGLLICRDLMGLMAGHIGFTSTPGEGSRFWIELPEAPAEAAGAARVAHAAMPARRARLASAAGEVRTVLCIEDNPSNLALIRQVLALLPNTRVLTAATGAAGLALAEQEQPDVIVADLNLSDMSGYDVLERLAGMAGLQATPVVALTADAMPDEVARGKAAGFFRYLTKPFMVDDVLGAVRQAFAEAQPQPSR